MKDEYRVECRNCDGIDWVTSGAIPEAFPTCGEAVYALERRGLRDRRYRIVFRECRFVGPTLRWQPATGGKWVEAQP